MIQSAIRLLTQGLVAAWPRLLICCLLFSGATLAADVPAVAASADMTFALTEMANSFSRQTNKQVRLVFGASTTLAQQIAEHGGYEIFLAADEAGAQSLAQAGKTTDEGKLYGVGRIVVFVPDRRNGPARKKSAPITGGLPGLKAAVESGQLKHLAVPDPEKCPYGRAAREALQEAGIWTLLGDRLTITEDAEKAAQLAFAGKVDAAVLPLSLGISPIAQSKGHFDVIDVKMHRTIRQRMVLMADAGETAKFFYGYLQSPVAKDILRRYGYTFALK